MTGAGTRDPSRRVPNEMALRSYEQIARILAERHGIRISSARVQQIAMKAEAKLRRAFAGEWRERMGANSTTEANG